MRSLQLLGAPPSPPMTAHGPLFAKGFRPFFLVGASFAAFIVPLWLLVLTGHFAVGAYFDPVSWHAHEMVFGFSGAIIAGFLLTAVGNWTGRETATGGTLVALAALWVLARLALLMPFAVAPWLVAALDLAFLPALAFAIGRPIVVTRNRRNAIVLVAVGVLWLANLVMHLDALGVLSGARRTGALVGVDVITLLMVIITGRVVPMFTKNATGDASVRSHPRADVLAVAATFLVILFDAVPVRLGPWLGFVVLAVAALAVGARSFHWGARRSLCTPLLWILHAGHAWMGIGLALRALALVTTRVPPAAGIHALTAGAIGSLTLGMMARVSLGHTGRALVLPRGVALAFGLITLAAILRVAAPLLTPAIYVAALAISAVAWGLAFAIYVTRYAPVLVAARADGKPG